MKPCSLSAFAVNVYMLSLLCSLSSTITTRHGVPPPEEKLPSLSVRGKLLSTANTGFKSNKLVTAQKNRAAILRLGRKGRQGLYLKKRPLVLLFQMH